MSGFPILDLVVGMIFIFFLLSIICSSAVELYFAMLRTRASLLQKWLKRIFDQDAFDSDGVPLKDKKGQRIKVGQAIMDHCITRALSETGKAPTYINAENFVSALLDKITLMPADKALEKLEDGVQPPPENLDKYIEAIRSSSVISGELKRTFLALAYEAKDAAIVNEKVKSTLDDFRGRLELWYNKNAERLTGKFKSTRVLPLTFIMALLITIGLNADSVALSRYLYTNKEVSRQLSDQAMAYVKENGGRIEQAINVTKDTTKAADSATVVKRLDSALAALKQGINYFKDSLPTGLPLGWKNEEKILKAGTTDVNWLQTFFNSAGKHGIGWLATILAICLGAPFWFDILNKIANLRSNGTRPPTDGLTKNKTG